MIPELIVFLPQIEQIISIADAMIAVIDAVQAGKTEMSDLHSSIACVGAHALDIRTILTQKATT